MAVTELALLRIIKRSTEGNTVPSAELRNHLRLAKDAMEKASGFSFYCLHCVEDPSLIFIVGGWPSVQFHLEEWLPSQENQALLQLMEGEVDVECMFHLEMDPKEREVPLRKGMVAIGRHSVEADNRQSFERDFAPLLESIERETDGKGNVRGGWRIDRGYVKGDKEGIEMEGEEWVMFMGMDSAVGSREFDWQSSEYFRLRGSVEGVDIKNSVPLWG